VSFALIDGIKNHGRLVQAVLLLVLFVAIAVSLRLLPVDPALEWLNDRADALGSWAAVAFVALFIGLTLFLLPGWPLNVIAGAIFGPIGGALLTSLASNSAAAVSFLVGRRLGTRMATRLANRYRRVEAVYRAFGRRGSWRLVAAVRLSHALPFGLQNLLLGASPVAFWTFLLTTFAVTLPGICVMAYLGHLGAAWKAAEMDAPAGGWQWALRGAGLLGAAVALGYLGHVLRRAIREEAGPDAREP
jgi:uncharacterized membrane protein YdjX (TVP38/TMEM64 family)